MSEKHWEVFEVIIGGKSVIDSASGLAGAIRDRGDADRFLKTYGYDLDDPIEAAEALGHFQEAVSFVRRFFLAPENPEGARLEIPRKVVEQSDLRDVVLMSAMAFPAQSQDTPGVLMARWACALLKVVHTLAHIDKDIRSLYFPDVQKAILDRYYRVVQRTADERLVLAEKLDDPDAIPLVAFETKPRKTRDSVLMKLLQKPENVADEIFDRVGVRFITATIADALRVVQFLSDHKVIVAANIKPSRSRNTLVDLSAGLQGENPNPHTSEHYRAIQFTCRQLVKFRNPLFDQIKAVKKLARGQTSDLSKQVEEIDLGYLHREVKFFYPYEVQVVDRESHRQNEEGRSAHRDYKRSQLQTAMKRVLGPLLG